ncbi:hypothetical protein [Sphingosinicella sp. BN140058]|uniref:hypothetical protein n=1 Tax=Sphingosinicella sp. BN140058 TaxID=1892855 RepID=UPI0010132E21|nr:hypothetical protein [Sphingosinicella sp. BN140058]QAY75359.1 hypothetical protein ETR14_01550 [Sphingosinicella sp. BN140058]
MIGKLLGGYVGSRVGERYGNEGLKGALIGVGASALARRGAGPLALVVGGAWVAKKVLEKRRGRTTATR